MDFITPSLELVTDKQHLVLLPACGMALWTLLCLVYMALRRNIALMKRQVSIKYYRNYDTASEPAWLNVIGQHIENLFEAPQLFYAVTIGMFATQTVTSSSVTLGYAYLGARILHTVVHCGSNNVTHRFVAYLASTVVLVVMWVQLTLRLVAL